MVRGADVLSDLREEKYAGAYAYQSLPSLLWPITNVTCPLGEPSANSAEDRSNFPIRHTLSELSAIAEKEQPVSKKRVRSADKNFIQVYFEISAPQRAFEMVRKHQPGPNHNAR